jgi:hypothetical protein
MHAQLFLKDYSNFNNSWLHITKLKLGIFKIFTTRRHEAREVIKQVRKYAN